MEIRFAKTELQRMMLVSTNRKTKIDNQKDHPHIHLNDHNKGQLEGQESLEKVTPMT